MRGTGGVLQYLSLVPVLEALWIDQDVLVVIYVRNTKRRKVDFVKFVQHAGINLPNINTK